MKEASYQALDVASFGALHRQDKLVDQNLAGAISDNEYYSKTSVNVALSAGQAAMTLGSGGAMGATRTAAVAWGAAGGIAGQGISDIGEIYGTETKKLEDVRARDYFLAGGMGAVGGYAGYNARGPARAGPSQAEKAGLIAEHGQSVTPEAPVPVTATPSATDVNVQPAVRRTYAVGEQMPDGRIAGEGPGAAPATAGALAPSSGTGRAAQIEVLAGSKPEHMNASIAEIHGYDNMLDRGYQGIRAPGKTTARGADSIAFDPTTREIVVQDAKYRGPEGRYPNKIPEKKLVRWRPDIRKGIEALPDGPLKDAARRAFEEGKIRPEVFKWPQ